MLRFARKPDRVFRVILHGALEIRRDMIAELVDFPARGREEYPAAFPALARFFAPEAALDVLDRLLQASKARTLYQLTDYHWLVLHDCLEAFCDLHNDSARDSRSGTHRVGPYAIGRIDFEAILDRFFWDTDFLAGPELLELTPEQRREQLGYSDETFGIAAGLAPHPDELRLTPWTAEPGWEAEPDPYPPRGRVPRYPPEVEENDASCA
jgi:hypothetical protein